MQTSVFGVFYSTFQKSTQRITLKIEGIKISIFICNGNYLLSRVLVFYGMSYTLNQEIVYL